MGLLDLTNSDLIQSHNDRQFLNKSVAIWEASASAEFKTSHTSVTYREKIPLRTTITKLNRLYSKCKSESKRDMLSIAYMYQVGFILPRSEILTQAWQIFSTGCVPDIGGKLVTYDECLKELRKHLKKAKSTSTNGLHVYCKEYLDSVDRWSAVVDDKSNGFLVYSFTSKTNTYIMTDAFVRKDDGWVSVFGAFLDSSIASTSKVREHGIPVDIGKFNVSNKSSRIIVPIDHNNPDLNTIESEYIYKLHAFNIHAFANTLTSEQAEILKFQAALTKAYAYIDTRFSESIKELISSRGRILAARSGESVKDRSDKRKLLVKDISELERAAYAKYQRKLKKHGERVGAKYYKLFEELGKANQQRLADFAHESSELANGFEERARKSTSTFTQELLTVNEGMTDLDYLALYSKRLSFIHKHTSGVYDANIDTVNKHTAKLKRYEKLVRDTNASLKTVKTDRKFKELNRLLTKYTRLRTKYRDCLKNMEVQVTSSRRHLQAIDATVTTVKLARKKPDWISVNANPERTKGFRPAKKFNVTPRGIICVSGDKHGSIKSGLKKKLTEVGFTV